MNAIFQDEFKAKIADDFNLPQGLAFVFEVLKSDISKPDKLATILDFDKVLGLKLKEEAEKTREKFSDTVSGFEDRQEVKKLIDQREIARKQKDFKKSDELRDKIKALGYEVKDTHEGQSIIKI